MTGDALPQAEEVWLIIDPSGVVDGMLLINARTPTLEAAQRRFAAPKRWATEAREGWTVRRGTPNEFDFDAALSAANRRRAGAS